MTLYVLMNYEVEVNNYLNKIIKSDRFNCNG